MILIIKTNKDILHDLEFVKPIREILKQNNKKLKITHYSEDIQNLLKQSEKVIITGTSLKDNDYLEDYKYFNWIGDFEKPLLGICAGMQLISLIFGGEKKQKTEIGFYEEDFNKDFLGTKGNKKVYHLHKNYFTLPRDFNVYSGKTIPQAIKHKKRNIFGILFHPEVRNKEIVENFINT